MLPAFGFDKRGRARPLAAVRRPATGVCNKFSDLEVEGLPDAEEVGAARALAKKKNRRQRLLQRERLAGVAAERTSTGGVAAERASTGGVAAERSTGRWCIATGSVILFVLLLAYLLRVRTLFFCSVGFVCAAFSAAWSWRTPGARSCLLGFVCAVFSAAWSWRTPGARSSSSVLCGLVCAAFSAA